MNTVADVPSDDDAPAVNPPSDPQAPAVADPAVLSDEPAEIHAAQQAPTEPDASDDVFLEPERAPEPDAEPEPEPDAAALQAQVAELSAAVATAQRRTDELIGVARRQTEMADELHAENKVLRAGEIREAVAPIVRGLARLADDLARMRSDHSGPEAADLEHLARRVAELLHDAGVLPVLPQKGDRFDPAVHHATGSAPTGDETAHRTIAEVRRAGLRRDDGRVFRAADVVVHRYVEPPPPPFDEHEDGAAPDDDNAEEAS